MTNTQRKTTSVSNLRDRVNGMIAATVENKLGPESRVSLAVLLESVLMDSGNYKGFRFTDGANGDLDRSRRYYY